MIFSFLNLLTSGIIIFILFSKQLSFAKLDLWNSKGDPLSASWSFLDLRFDQHPYPRRLSCHQLAQHLPPNTYAFLRVLNVASYGLFPRMCLHTVDSARDVSNNQWGASMPFLLSFRCVVWLPLDTFSRRINFPGMCDLDHR